MEIKEILKNDNIYLNTSFRTKEEVITFLASELMRKKYISDEKAFYQAVFERENHATTGIGNGIAIPHGKSLAVNESTVVFLKNNFPLEWQSLDDQPVELVFLLAITEADKGDTHLKLLSILAGKLMDDQIVDDLHKQNNAETIIEILNREESE